MSYIKMLEGSSACNGREEVVFLIASVNSIGDIKPQNAEWYRAIHGWQALDEASKELGSCKILKSIIASKYDAYCAAMQ